MALSFLFLKYAVVFAGIGSATVAPLMSSFSNGGAQVTSRGGQSTDSGSNIGQVSYERRKVLSEQDIKDFDSTFEDETSGNGLSVNHAFYEHMKKTVGLDEFKKYYGALDLKEEHLSGSRVTKKDIGPNRAKDMNILDAGEKFFREEKKDTNDKTFSYFKEGSYSLPFWNYDFPYIAVEFPKNYKLPENLVDKSLDKGGVKVEKGLLPTGFAQYGIKGKGLTDSAYNFKKVMTSQGEERSEHIKKDTLNKIMRASPDADLYLVASPEKLLRMGLGEWEETEIKEKPSEDKYALFKNNYYAASADHPEVSVLTRGHNGKTYRMGIHHKTLKENNVQSNDSRKKILAGRYRFSVGKDHKYVDPKLKGGSNFLLNLMTWYAYTYKLDKEIAPNRSTYQTVARAGEGNLLDIYDLDKGANSRNSRYRDNFAKGVKEWYTGEERNNEQYGKNVYNKFNLTDMTHFANRWERIQGVGQSMDELKDDGGQVKSNSQTSKKA